MTVSEADDRAGPRTTGPAATRVWRLSELVELLGGRLRGADRHVRGIAALDGAAADELSFLVSLKHLPELATCRSGALIVPPACADAAAMAGRSLILTPDPYLYFAQAALLMYPPMPARGGVDPRAVIGIDGAIAASTEVRALACIGDRVTIGERCVIHAGVVIGDDVRIGDDSVLHPRVVVHDGCEIGRRVTICSGAVIGADGFGMAWDGERWCRIPQRGGVVIGDDAEIGANTAIDRGTLTDTVIGRDVRIDNLVQIAHNVRIGDHTAIAGCVGIAGSTRIGARCLIGGAAMVVGHLSIADGTTIGSGTRVSKSVREAGHYTSYFPFSSFDDWRLNAAHLRQLDRIVGRVKEVEAAVKALGKSQAPPADV
ncbi:UDP-3-O-(3-hydroxymyristoyl)glucosamine N-acyltransferase [Roseateles noduli]|nr:UDP-3-O-(3-hydroxymyristoyl)glucosamine N-acyltransferase [Roseateles noduli]